MSNLPFVEETAGSGSSSGSAPPLWVSGAYYSAGVSAVSPPDVVTSPTDFQCYIRIVSGTGSTDPSSDTTNWRPSGDRAIKSIQRGTATGLNVAIAISSVDTAKTEVRWLGGFGTDGGGINPGPPRLALTSATVLQMTNYSGTGSGSVSWEITERY